MEFNNYPQRALPPRPTAYQALQEAELQYRTAYSLYAREVLLRTGVAPPTTRDLDLAIKEFQILELVNIAKRQESDIAALVTRCKDRQTEVTALVKELTEISELVTEFRGKKEEIEEVGHFNKATGRWTGPVRDNILTYHANLKRLVKGFMEAKERILVLEKQVRDLKNGGESMEESGRVRIKTEPGEPED